MGVWGGGRFAQGGFANTHHPPSISTNRQGQQAAPGHKCPGRTCVACSTTLCTSSLCSTNHQRFPVPRGTCTSCSAKPCCSQIASLLHKPTTLCPCCGPPRDCLHHIEPSALSSAGQRSHTRAKPLDVGDRPPPLLVESL